MHVDHPVSLERDTIDLCPFTNTLRSQTAAHIANPALRLPNGCRTTHSPSAPSAKRRSIKFFHPWRLEKLLGTCSPIRTSRSMDLLNTRNPKTAPTCVPLGKRVPPSLRSSAFRRY